MKSGEIRNVLIVAELIELGGAKCVLSLVQDITKRKKAEEKLRRSEAYLAEAERLSHTASWAWNVSTGAIFWSRELFQIYGLDPEKVTLGYPSVMKYIHPDDRSRVRKTFDGAVRKRKDYESAYRVVRADGTVRQVNNIAHPVFDKAGTLIEYVGTTIDITERKQAEEAARKAREQVDLILASISDQFFGLSKDWRFTYFNQHAAAQLKLLGKDPAELLGKVLWDEFPEVPNEANLRRVMSERVALTEELYYVPLGHWLENHIYPSPDGGIVTFQRYVTERKKAEAELRRNAAYLAQGQRLSHTGSWALNVATRELFWSEEHFRILGLDPGMETPPYPEAIKFIYPDDRPWVVAALERAMREKTEFDTQCRVVRADGTIRFIRSVAQPVFNKAGDLVEYVGTMVDMTEQLRAEENLRRSESHLAEAQRIGHIGSFIWNATTGECHWSKEHFRMVGVDPDTFKPTRDNTKELIHPDDLPLMEQALTKAIRERSDYEIEYRIMRADGVRYHRCIGRPVAKSNGDLQFTGVVVDLTERKQTEQALQEAQTELAHVSRMTAMGEMAAAIAHEINQPLGAIMNNSSYCLQLLARPEAETKKRAALEDIANDANRASAIIERIRGITKGSAREITKLNASELIGDVLTLTQRLLEENHIQLRTSAPDDLPEISADRVQLQQVLFNLVVNSIEAMSGMRKDKRVLTIEAAHSAFEHSAAILITVADTGRGFESAAADRMFDAFYTTKPGGMGMGLRVSRSIIEGHGGKLSARRNKGRGATFSFVLPV
jgi:PAS domain S-box-containing protein